MNLISRRHLISFCRNSRSNEGAKYFILIQIDQFIEDEIHIAILLHSLYIKSMYLR